ncbi:efflux transporter, RND family, MFP subunit [Desulfurispirillum indicum S5]|uniref:Efflux transporter, RND family, MFP subunit n=1 Tax=Desulfurispirillum indicum (strain ATCC BAA-1389 / DSM 22839 / S5) TaxID=653733 RepID=E6W526_DESIS|nr:efflux RND transporter periplasmic adaptor subunit [Desulfurispirillum indicum]ADU66002.1 efflux transporter, RND family, MFP subunit [Desulfurispirillum indicum S5]
MSKSQSALLPFLFLLLGIPAFALETTVVNHRVKTEYLQLDGTVEAVRQSTVSAQTSGTVKAIYFDVDDAVPAGALILELDDREHRARVNQARAAFNEATAGLNDAQSNHERVKRLHEQGIASPAQFDQARNQLSAAQARLARSQAALEESQQHLAYTSISAPYGGLVTRRHVEIGEAVSPGTPLLSGLTLEELRVVTALPQRFAALSRQERKFRVIMDDGTPLETGVTTLYPYADPSTHTFRVRIDIENPAASLFPGMLVRVEVPVAQRSALWIPTTSLVRQGELRAVYVMDENMRPRLRQVRVGSHDGELLEILAGLSAGEIIALHPHEALQLLQTRSH